ncbi:hypothetical protein MP638_002822 [Amoeboaphelidium occidentale]|nr:hypothetical protein MP638_002822 [Amoeboaphelidium occidentale]
MSNQQDRKASIEELLELLRRKGLHDLLQNYHESAGSIMEIWIQSPMEYWVKIAGFSQGFSIYNVSHPLGHFQPPAELKEDYPDFRPSYYTLEFPFFGRKRDKAAVAPVNDDMLMTINENVHNGFRDHKYRPIIISASHGMDAKSLLKAIGLQSIPEHLNCPEIVKAGQCGRILSFDVSLGLDGIHLNDNVLTFFQRLMVHYLCRMICFKCVGGIYFRAKVLSLFPIAWKDIEADAYPGTAFYRWLSMCRGFSVDEMIDEYMRLTNIAFRVDYDFPPVILLNGVERFANVRTNRISKPDGSYHTRLSLLLTQLAGRHKPQSISAVKKNGYTTKVVSTSLMEPLILQMSSL